LKYETLSISGIFVKIKCQAPLHERKAPPHKCKFPLLTVLCKKLRKHFNAIMEVFYCFTVSIDLPSDASDYNDDKRSAVAESMQNAVVVE